MQAPLPANENARLRELDELHITDTEPEASFDRIVRLAAAATDMPIALISLIDNERQWFKAKTGLELEETPREDAFCAHAILNDDVMVVEDATKDPRFADNPLVTQKDGIRFYAGAPLKTRKGNNLGTLCVIDTVPRKLTPNVLRILADMAALVVNEIELRKLSGVDALTGSFNRRFGEELAQREFRRAYRTVQPLTVALLDADHFKSINDTFGHPAGDEVLRKIAKTCEAEMRSYDFFARYGGEEFLAILPNTAAPSARILLERLLKKISELEIPELQGRKVTVSIGMAELTNTDKDHCALIARADKALYKAKKNGRNRLEFSWSNELVN